MSCTTQIYTLIPPESALKGDDRWYLQRAWNSWTPFNLKHLCESLLYSSHYLVSINEIDLTHQTSHKDDSLLDPWAVSFGEFYQRYTRLIAPIMAVVSIAEALTNFYHCTARNNPEYTRLHICHRENMKSHQTCDILTTGNIVTCLLLKPNWVSLLRVRRTRREISPVTYNSILPTWSILFTKKNLLLSLSSILIYSLSNLAPSHLPASNIDPTPPFLAQYIPSGTASKILRLKISSSQNGGKSCYRKGDKDVGKREDWCII